MKSGAEITISTPGLAGEIGYLDTSLPMTFYETKVTHSAGGVKRLG